jgi:hypothetical protein
MTSAPMPSLPGKTAWTVNTSLYEGQVGAGFSLAHRFTTTIPLALTVGYGNGGGQGHVGRVGLMGEF